MVIAWSRKTTKHILSPLRNLNLIVKKQQTPGVSTAEHVQPRNVMQETKSSNICNIEFRPIYVTSVYIHTYTAFCWASIKFWVLTEKAINRETDSVITGFGIVCSGNRALVRMPHDDSVFSLYLKKLTSLVNSKLTLFFLKVS